MHVRWAVYAIDLLTLSACTFSWYTRRYHGYWPKNFYELNEHFGNDADMKAMVDALHAADISVMLDTVGVD